MVVLSVMGSQSAMGAMGVMWLGGDWGRRLGEEARGGRGGAGIWQVCCLDQTEWRHDVRVKLTGGDQRRPTGPAPQPWPSVLRVDFVKQLLMYLGCHWV